MAALAGVVIVPLLLLGIVQSVYRQSASSLLRSVLVNVPLAVLLTAVAVQLVQTGSGGDRRHERGGGPGGRDSTPVTSCPR